CHVGGHVLSPRETRSASSQWRFGYRHWEGQCNDVVMKKGGVVYILTNKHHTTLYPGVTSDLWKRLNDHVSGIRPGSFTSKYNVNKLVYFELFHSIEEAILREK